MNKQKKQRTNSTRDPPRHAETVEVHSLMKAVAPRKGKSVINVGKKITLLKCVEESFSNRVPHLVNQNNPENREGYLYTMTSENRINTKVKVSVGGNSFQTTVDTGATINVIDQKTYSQMKDVKLRSTNTTAFAYNTTTSVHFMGKFEAVVETRNRTAVATFYVVKGEYNGNLPSLSTAQDLGLISLHLNKISVNDTGVDEILARHAKVFEGLGKLKLKTRDGEA